MISWFRNFISQPHKPFFTIGIIMFMFFILLFILIYSNQINVQAPLIVYHAYSLIFVVFIQLFFGFLFVVFPKFLLQNPIKVSLYTRLFLLNLISSLGIFFSLIYFYNITFIFQSLLLISQVLCFKILYFMQEKSTVLEKNDTKWILISLFIGLISHFIFIFSSFNKINLYFIEKIAINSGFYLCLFMIFFTISQKMIPIFTRAMIPSYKINKTNNIVSIVFFLLLLKVITLSFDNVKFNLISDIPLLFFISRELYKWKLPLFRVLPIVWILYIPLYWICISLFISILESIFSFLNFNLYFEKAVIHSISIGFFTTIFIGFATRVILGHSHQAIFADKITIFLFIAFQILTILRIFTSLSFNLDLNYLLLLNVTSILFLLCLFFWSIKYLAILFTK